MAKEFEAGETYQIAFMDHRSPDYTWYTGEAEAVYVRASAEDFGEGEQHHVFRLPSLKAGDDECTFPESCISLPIDVETTT